MVTLSLGIQVGGRPVGRVGSGGRVGEGWGKGRVGINPPACLPAYAAWLPSQVVGQELFPAAAAHTITGRPPATPLIHPTARLQVGSWSRVLEDAVRSLINDHGVTVVVASGNSGVDACYVAPGAVGGSRGAGGGVGGWADGRAGRWGAGDCNR